MEIITGRYTIKQIFKDHWAAFLKKYQRGIPEPDKLRPYFYLKPELMAFWSFPR
jgi:hypothetical protein